MVENADETDLLAAISDDYMRRIISSTITEAKSLEEISRECGIPLSTCYRRMHTLVKSSLLKAETIVITPDGKKRQTYRSKVKGVTISFFPDEFSINSEPNMPAENKKQKTNLIQKT